MGRKKKRNGRRAASALSPINKKGIKLGTLITEIGIGGLAFEAYDRHGKSGDYGGMGSYFATKVLDPSGTYGKLVLTGIGIALIGRFTGFKGFGPIQLS